MLKIPPIFDNSAIYNSFDRKTYMAIGFAVIDACLSQGLANEIFTITT
jgi:hypothetical protein